MDSQTKKKSSLSQLLAYAGGHKKLTLLGCTLSGVSAVLSMAVYIWITIFSLCLRS